MPLKNPVYSLKTHESLCDMRLNINNDINYCRSETKKCTDTWVKLHARDSWLFTCCQECYVRILCPAGVSQKRLQGTGIIALGQGCVMKGDTYSIHAHYDFINRMYVQPKIDTIKPFISSPLNEIINTTLPHYTVNTENHTQLYNEIQQKIDILKSQTPDVFTNDELPHHIVNYGISSALVAVILLYTLYKLKQRCKKRPRTREEPPIEMTRRRPGVSECKCSVANEVVPCHIQVASPVKCCDSNQSVNNLNKSTSSFMIDHTVTFD